MGETKKKTFIDNICLGLVLITKRIYQIKLFSIFSLVAIGRFFFETSQTVGSSSVVYKQSDILRIRKLLHEKRKFCISELFLYETKIIWNTLADDIPFQQTVARV